MNFFETPGGITLAAGAAIAAVVTAIAVPITVNENRNGPYAKITACTKNGGTWNETATANACTSK